MEFGNRVNISVKETIDFKEFEFFFKDFTSGNGVHCTADINDLKRLKIMVDCLITLSELGE